MPSRSSSRPGSSVRTLHPRPGAIEHHLHRLPLFEQLTGDEFHALAQQATLRSYARDEVVFEAGESAEALFCVVSGSLRIVRPLPGGEERVLHIALAPTTVAEMPVMVGRPFPARGICNDASTLVVIPRATLLKLVQQDPHFPLRMLGAAMKRLRLLTEAIARQGHLGATSRVAAYLQGLARGCVHDPAETPEIVLPAAKKDIANYLGLKPESLSRALASLKKRGVIEVEDNLVRVLDARALDQVVGPR